MIEHVTLSEYLKFKEQTNTKIASLQLWLLDLNLLDIYDMIECLKLEIDNIDVDVDFPDLQFTLYKPASSSNFAPIAGTKLENVRSTWSFVPTNSQNQVCCVVIVNGNTGVIKQSGPVLPFNQEVGSGADEEARRLIREETYRAQAEESNLQDQIDRLKNSTGTGCTCDEAELLRRINAAQSKADSAYDLAEEAEEDAQSALNKFGYLKTINNLSLIGTTRGENIQIQQISIDESRNTFIDKNGNTVALKLSPTGKLYFQIQEQGIIYVDSVRINTTWMPKVGDNIQFRASVSPSYANDTSISWTSNQKDVISITPDGYATALKSGYAIITASANDGNGAFDNAQIYVSENTPETIHVTSVSVTPAELSLTEGNTYQLFSTVLPSNASNKSVTWESNDTNVATVSSNGLVTAKKAGSTVIKVTTNDGNYTARCYLTVTSAIIPVESITLSKSTLSLDIEETDTLTATVLPSNATNKNNIIWHSSNSNIASASNGVVEAKSIGTAVITASIGNVYSNPCTVTVTQHVTEPNSITIKPSSITLNPNHTYQLTATVLPAEAVDKEVTWTSLNRSIATVDRNTGFVTAIAPGTATITAATSNGVSATCVVTVVEPTPVEPTNYGRLYFNAVKTNGVINWNAAENVDMTSKSTEVLVRGNEDGVIYFAYPSTLELTSVQTKFNNTWTSITNINPESTTINGTNYMYAKIWNTYDDGEYKFNFK